jgi:predicted transcriptional regulator
LDLKVVAGEGKLTQEVSGGYIGDLLSDVMGNGKAGDVWITRQIHQNIVAVASLKDLAGIILVNGCEPAADTIDKARRENIPVMITAMSGFEVAGKLYNLVVNKISQP